ncbi:MAG: hypothetical protein HY855_13340 [Burkholderiales bacterium]|nr:hypothetical protein [Burkholderiales bacterium]
MGATVAQRLERWTWVLIYGGLLTLVLGLAVERVDSPLGWSLVVGGGAATLAGVLLIVLRSRIKS